MTVTEPAFFEIIDREFRFDVPGVLEGWTTPDKGKRLAELVLENKPETVIDLGVFGGRSLIAMALACRENEKGRVYGIDPWKLSTAIEGEKDQANIEWWKNVDMHNIHRGTIEAIWRLKLDDWIVIIRNASQQVPHLFSGGIDFIHVDGNHSEIASCRDIELYCPMLNWGGFLIFDDKNWDSTQKAVKLIEQWCELIEDHKDYGIYKRK